MIIYAITATAIVTIGFVVWILTDGKRKKK